MYSNSKEYEESRRLLIEAIATAKAKENQLARRLFNKILRLPSTSEQTAEAHYWLSEISQDSEEKRNHLELALGYNPAHHLARKKLAILNGKLHETEIIDPNYLHPDIATPPIASEGNRFVCNNCGGTLTYSPDGENLICEYCESEIRITTNGKVSETDFVIGISTTAGHKRAVSMQSFECNACQVIFLLQPETLSLTCPYCDSTYTINSLKTSQLLPPEGIIPFDIERDEIEKIILHWVRSKRISKKPHFKEFTGIYHPVWTFDISGVVKWKGDITQVDRFYTDSNQKHFIFDDILIPACKQKPIKFQEILSGYKTTDIIPFSHEYITNWIAETYTVTMSDAAIEAHSEAFIKAKSLLEKQDNFRHHRNISYSSTGLIIEDFKLILVPIWLGVYIFSGHQYNVTINGKTGDIRGELPPTRLESFTTWLLKSKSN